MIDIITAIRGAPILWTDKAGTTHLCEGAYVHPGIRLLWARCHSSDVPGGKAWIGGDVAADCMSCLSVAGGES